MYNDSDFADQVVDWDHILKFASLHGDAGHTSELDHNRQICIDPTILHQPTTSAAFCSRDDVHMQTTFIPHRDDVHTTAPAAYMPTFPNRDDDTTAPAAYLPTFPNRDDVHTTAPAAYMPTFPNRDDVHTTAPAAYMPTFPNRDDVHTTAPAAYMPTFPNRDDAPAAMLFEPATPGVQYPDP